MADTDDAPELVIRCWPDKYRGAWLVIRASDRRILTSGSVDHCLDWRKRNEGTAAALAPGTPLSPKLDLGCA